jgi:hypothetical protein
MFPRRFRRGGLADQWIYFLIVDRFNNPQAPFDGLQIAVQF